MGNLVTWNLKDENDIQLKHFFSVNNFSSKIKGPLNNYVVTTKHFFMHSVVLLIVPSSGIFLANHLMTHVLRGRTLYPWLYNLPHRTHRHLLSYVVGCEHLRENLINRFTKYFDLLMSSSNAIAQLMAFNAVLSNTAIGLNKTFFSSRNSARTDENGKGKFVFMLFITHSLWLLVYSSVSKRWYWCVNQLCMWSYDSATVLCHWFFFLILCACTL